jgi:hypothetical protein
MARISQLHLNKSPETSVCHDDEDSDGVKQDPLFKDFNRQHPFYTGFNTRNSERKLEMDDRQTNHEFRETSDTRTQRNDAVAPVINTVSRKNITMRRSQGRTKDRESVGAPSIPVDKLISRRVKPREKDRAYAEEVRGTSQTPAALVQPDLLSQRRNLNAAGLSDHDVRTAGLSDHDVREFRTPISHASLRRPDITRSYFPSAELNPDLRTKLNQMWVEKLDVDDRLQAALDADNEREYRALQGQYDVINDLMHALIQSHNSPIPPQPSHGSSSAPSASRIKPWNNKESSFTIYLQTTEITVPWTVWPPMPVALLVPAAASVLAMCGRVIAPQHISLLYLDEVLNTSYGRLSDYDIRNEDTVLVETTMTGGGFLTPDRSPQGTGMDAKPKPTGDPRGHDNVFPRTEPGHNEHRANRESGMDNRAYDKLKQTFKCPKFSGQPKDWKQWNKGLQRYLSIWELDHVLDPDFFDNLPLTADKIRDNKLVYYIIEDATQGSPLAASYIRQAPNQNGFEAYYTLHDGFVFAGSTASTVLLNELANFRFKANESPTELIMRLEELFQDLEMLPDNSAMVFNDTQRIGYLLGALRHETQWAGVASTIVSAQLKGDMTFQRACGELKIRCEADQAYNMIDKQVIRRKKAYKATVVVEGNGGSEAEVEPAAKEDVQALVSSAAKRLNKVDGSDPVKTSAGGRKKRGKKIYENKECIAKGCKTLSTFPLCGLHYHSLMSGKTPGVELDNNWGTATYNTGTDSIEYPEKVPETIRPKQ